VCSGLAARLGFPVWSTRLLMIILFLHMPFIVGVGYLVAHCSLPVKGY
jgi:phage shock protein C